jgi:hypothetical protein
MKHTKGTWEPFSYHNLDIAQEGVRYGVSSSNGKYIGEEMTEGDANLIANAPEMLAMLKQMVGELDDTWMLNADVGKIGGKTKYDVKRLIAKAEGGAS